MAVNAKVQQEEESRGWCTVLTSLPVKRVPEGRGRFYEKPDVEAEQLQSGFRQSFPHASARPPDAGRRASRDSDADKEEESEEDDEMEEGEEDNEDAEEREGAVLRKAEQVILHQRNRLEELSSLLLKAEQEKLIACKASLNDVRRYAEENKTLRLRLDAAAAEVAANEGLRLRHEKIFNELSDALAAAEQGIAERDRILAMHQDCAEKLREDVQLKEELQRARCQLAQLTARASMPGMPADSSGGSHVVDEVARQVGALQRGVDYHRALSKQFGRTVEELRVSKMCIVQSESEQLEAQRVVEEQRLEIQRLYRVIDSMNKEKALMPPLVLAPPQIPGLKETRQKLEQVSQQVMTLHAKVDATAAAAAEGPAGDPLRSRCVLALASQRLLEEQKQLLARLLQALELLVTQQRPERKAEKGRPWEMEKDVYYSGLVLQARTEEPEEHPPYHERLLAARAGCVGVFYDFTDEEPVEILHAHRVVDVAIDYEELLYCIELEVHAGVSEFHYIKCADHDDMEKWRYALMYAGLLRAEQPAVGRRRVVPAPLAPRPAEFRGLRVSYVAPSGKTADMQRSLPFSAKDLELIFDADNNSIVCQDAAEPEKTLRIPCSKVLYEVDPERYSFTFTLQEGPPAEYIIQTTEENFGEVESEIAKGSYWSARAPSPQPGKPAMIRKPSSLRPRKKSLPPPPRAPKAPAPSAKPPKEGKGEEVAAKEREGAEDELFFVRDGCLLLFEKAGDIAPLLKLKNTDCITTADDRQQEFVVRHMPDTADEETYVFGFASPEIYDRWLRKLRENGFFDRKDVGGVNKLIQAGVVTKGLLQLYRYYGDPNAEPVLVLQADHCVATASRERRDIRITHTTPEGKRERITLDCATLAEFDRWNVALTFGGFLKEAGVLKAGTLGGYANLNKYVFPINLFEEGVLRRFALTVKTDALELFVSPEATEPVLSIPREKTQTQYFVQQRKIRVYVNRGSDQEERIDFILPLAKNYDRLTEACVRHDFPPVDAQSKKASMKAFVLCKKGLVAIYKTKFHKTPEITVDSEKYDGMITADNVVIFTPHLPPEAEPTAKAKKTHLLTDEARRKWEFCFKVTGYDIFYEGALPRFFFPQIVYGFVCEEAEELWSPPPSARTALFSPGRAARQQRKREGTPSGSEAAAALDHLTGPANATA